MVSYWDTERFPQQHHRGVVRGARELKNMEWSVNYDSKRGSNRAIGRMEKALQLTF